MGPGGLGPICCRHPTDHLRSAGCFPPPPHFHRALRPSARAALTPRPKAGGKRPCKRRRPRGGGDPLVGQTASHQAIAGARGHCGAGWCAGGWSVELAGEQRGRTKLLHPRQSSHSTFDAQRQGALQRDRCLRQVWLQPRWILPLRWLPRVYHRHEELTLAMQRQAATSLRVALWRPAPLG